jgi:hypothetical protein
LTITDTRSGLENGDLSRIFESIFSNREEGIGPCL